MPDKINGQILEILKQVSMLDDIDSMNLLLKEDLGINSIKSMSLITNLSDEFAFELTSENDMLDYFAVKNVKDLVQFVNTRIKK